VHVGAYLYRRKPDLKKLGNAIATSIKDKVIEAQRDRFTEFAYRIKTFDWEWVDENSNNKSYLENNIDFSRNRLIARMKRGQETMVMDDLYNVFKLIFEDTRINKPTFIRKIIETDWLQRTEKKEYLKDHTGIAKQVRILLIQSTQSSSV